MKKKLQKKFRKETFEKNLNKVTMLLVFVFALVLVFESLWDNAVVFKTELLFIDAFVSTVFLIEYVYFFILAKKKIKHVLSFERLIDLVSFLPFFLWLIAVGDSLKLLRLFRMLRVLRVLRLVKWIPLTDGFIKSLQDYKEEYKAVAILSGITIFIISSFVYFAEKDVDWTMFTSIPMALRWWLVTTTTVWYGDLYPLTHLGKVFGAFLVFFWPLVLSLASAITVMVFMDTSKKNEMKKWTRRGWLCAKCWDKNPKNANYCMHCGDKKAYDDKEINLKVQDKKRMFH